MYNVLVYYSGILDNSSIGQGTKNLKISVILKHRCRYLFLKDTVVKWKLAPGNSSYTLKKKLYFPYSEIAYRSIALEIILMEDMD